MRTAFLNTLLEEAKRNRNVELIAADVGFGILRPFWETLPDQFLNVGIAEQNMTSMAAGMALEGKTVFTYSVGNFPTLRCLEQIRNDCAYHGANVKIIAAGGGFAYGSLGISHHTTEDLAVMRAIPGVTVFAPSDAAEAEAVTAAAVSHPGVCYIRLGRGGEPSVRETLPPFVVGKALEVQQGSRVALFSTGIIWAEVDTARRILEQTGITPTVYTFPTVMPLDEEVIRACAQSHDLIVTCEEHGIHGGFGSGVADVMAQMECRGKLLKIGISGDFCREVGDQAHLRRVCGLDGETIARRIREALSGCNPG